MTATDRDWLYLKVYSGSGDDVGALLPAVLEWSSALEGVDRWHFLRYMDSSGHHLRVRLRGRSPDVDDWYRDLPRLDRLTRRETGRAMTRVIRDPLADGSGHRHGVTVSLYSPELSKYGGAEGMEDAELLFQSSSEACAANRVWMWTALERLLAAVVYIGSVERESGLRPGALAEQIADRWSTRLVYGGLDPDKIRREAPTLYERVRSQADPPTRWGELVPRTSEVLARWASRAAPDFALDIIHMHINRVGLNPLEECLAAHLCAAPALTDSH